MKKNKCVALWTSTGYPFAVYGKRGARGILIEWQWGYAAVRIPMWFAVRFPDTALSLAAGKGRVGK